MPQRLLSSLKEAEYQVNLAGAGASRAITEQSVPPLPVRALPWPWGPSSDHMNQVWCCTCNLSTQEGWDFRVLGYTGSLRPA